MLPTACWVLPKRRRPRAWSTARGPSVQLPCSSASTHAGTQQAAECCRAAQASRRQGRVPARPRRRRATSWTVLCPLVNPATWLDVRAGSLLTIAIAMYADNVLTWRFTDAEDLETLRKAFTFEPARKK